MKPLYTIILCVVISTACAAGVGIYTAERAKSYEKGINLNDQLTTFCETHTDNPNWQIEIKTGSTTGTLNCI